MGYRPTYKLEIKVVHLVVMGVWSIVAGCEVHHYHHFDDASLQALTKSSASGSSVQGIQIARTDSPVKASVRLGKPREVDDSHVEAASYKGIQPDGANREPSTPEKVEPLQGLTFDQAIAATLTADPKIRAGIEAIAQARADFVTSSLLPNPVLVTNGDFLPVRAFSPERPGGPPELDVQVGFPIDWFLFGKRAAAMASANLGIRQSEADFADLVRRRVAATSQAYYDVVEAKALLEMARADNDNLTKFQGATRKAVDAGGRPVVDLNRVTLDILKSQQAVREAEATLAIAKGNLRALLGRTDSDPNFDVSADLNAPITIKPISVEEAFALAQENRPDIQSLRWQVSRSQADVVVERRKAFPQVTPQVGYSRQYQTTALGVPDADSLFVSVNTTLPFFDRNQGNRMKSQSVALQNNLNLQSGVVDLRAEIEQVVEEFRTAHYNASAISQQQLKLAEDVLKSITEAYNAGGRTLVDVLDAQRNYHDINRLYITSRANYWRSVHKLSAAIGKQVLQP